MRFNFFGTKIFKKSYRFIFSPKNVFWVIKIAVNCFFLLFFCAYFDAKFVQIDQKSFFCTDCKKNSQI